MTKVMVLTHGPLSEALLASAEMILGTVGGAVAVGFRPGDGPEDLSAVLDPLLAAETDGVLCLTDLQGGTPARVAASYVPTHRIDVVCGVNLPMVLEVVAAGDAPIEALTAMAVAAGRDAVVDLGAALRGQLASETPERGVR